MDAWLMLRVHTAHHACRYAWDQLAEAEEVADDYGLGARDSLQDAVEAVIAILGMKVHAGLGVTAYHMFMIHSAFS